MPALRTTTTPGEAALIVAICFGVMILSSLHAVLSGFPETPFSDAGLIWLLANELVFAAVAILILRQRGYAVTTLLPQPTVSGCLVGIGLYISIWLLGWAITAPFAAEQPVQPVERMVSGAALSLPIIIAFAMVNGVFEEVFLLAFLVRGLCGYGLSIAIGVPLLVRILYHLYQGPIGALWILVFGAVLTIYYVRSGKLWPPVFAHILGDIVPFMIE